MQDINSIRYGKKRKIRVHKKKGGGSVGRDTGRG